MNYNETDLVKIAKRENNTKRSYLVVNPLQGKHIPVSPSKAIDLFNTLATELKERYKDCDNETLSQYTLVISIREYIQSIPQEKREIQKFMKKFTKQGKKERMILERWPRIRKAILEENVSFRKLAKFLNEKYDLDVTYSYINKIWNKIEGDL